MNIRLKNLQKKISSEKLDGFVSFKPPDIFYLTGFPAENSLLFNTRKKMVLVVSELVYPSAKRYADCEVRIMKKDFFEEYKNKKIGFEDSVSVSRIKKLKKTKGVKFVSYSGFVGDFRSVKDKNEILKIKTACKISQKTIGYAGEIIRAGITEKEIADRLEYFLRRCGAEKSAFDTIVASGKNSADPHHKPSAKKIQKNDIVVVDLGCVYEGYNSDLTRTFFLGKINKYAENVFNIVKEAQEKATSVIKDGVSCGKVDLAARDFISKKGFGKYFIHGTGHGVGIEIHEEPSVSAKSKTILRAGMVVTVEPGIYIPDKFGVRIEDTVLVTKSGSEVLTRC